MENLSTLSTEINRLHAELCSALADPTRILILYLLADQPFTVNEISSRLGVSQPSASRHLKVLRGRGMVRAERQGQMVEYSLTDRRLVESLDLLRAVLRDGIAAQASLLSIQE